MCADVEGNDVPTFWCTRLSMVVLSAVCKCNAGVPALSHPLLLVSNVVILVVSLLMSNLSLPAAPMCRCVCVNRCWCKFQVEQRLMLPFSLKAVDCANALVPAHPCSLHHSLS